jgi:hypothetical protein
MRSLFHRIGEQFTMENDNSKVLRSMAGCEFLFVPVQAILDSSIIQASITFVGQLLGMECEPELDTTDTLIYFIDQVVRRLKINETEVARRFSVSANALLRKKVIIKNEHEVMTVTKWNAAKRDGLKRYGLSKRQKRDEGKKSKTHREGKALKKSSTSPFDRTPPKLGRPSINVGNGLQDSRSPTSVSLCISSTKMSPSGSYGGAVKGSNGRENAAAEIRVPVPSDLPAISMSNKQAIEEEEFKAAVPVVGQFGYY